MVKRFFHQLYRWHQRGKAERTTPCISYLLGVVATKFLLEVMGAAGATWGSSEILFLRDTSEGTERMRRVVLGVGGVFLMRYWWHIKHWWQHERDYLPTKTIHRRRHRLAFFQIHASNFVLQVLGGAGAIWGCAEAVTLRNFTNTMEWRIAAMSVGAMFLIRWSFQILAYCLLFAALWSNPSSIHMTLLRWHEAIIVKLILEVFGAVGAVWGFSEIITLRTSETIYIWRPISLAVGVIFTMRWIIHFVNFFKMERASAAQKGQVQVEETRFDEIKDMEVTSDLEFKTTFSMSGDALESSTSLEVHTPMEVLNETFDGHTINEIPPPSLTGTHQTTPQKRQSKQITTEENDMINEDTS